MGRILFSLILLVGANAWAFGTEILVIGRSVRQITAQSRSLAEALSVVGLTSDGYSDILATFPDRSSEIGRELLGLIFEPVVPGQVYANVRPEATKLEIAAALKALVELSPETEGRLRLLLIVPNPSNAEHRATYEKSLIRLQAKLRRRDEVNRILISKEPTLADRDRALIERVARAHDLSPEDRAEALRGLSYDGLERLDRLTAYTYDGPAISDIPTIEALKDFLFQKNRPSANDAARFLIRELDRLRISLVQKGASVVDGQIELPPNSFLTLEVAQDLSTLLSYSSFLASAGIFPEAKANEHFAELMVDVSESIDIGTDPRLAAKLKVTLGMFRSLATALSENRLPIATASRNVRLADLHLLAQRVMNLVQWFEFGSPEWKEAIDLLYSEGFSFPISSYFGGESGLAFSQIADLGLKLSSEPEVWDVLLRVLPYIDRGESVRYFGDLGISKADYLGGERARQKWVDVMLKMPSIEPAPRPAYQVGRGDK